jgi:putative pre-16S rRNA nuclease
VSRILGLDIGDKRIGVAMSDPTEVLASPLTIIDRATDSEAIAGILKIIAENKVTQVVVGLPRTKEGDIGHQAQKVQSFIDTLRPHITVPLEYRDERLTTVSAMRLKQEASTRKLSRKTRYDAMAAAVILQEYLDEKS